MAGFFDYIPIIVVILFATGIIGAMVYERVKTKNIEKSSSWTQEKLAAVKKVIKIIALISFIMYRLKSKI